MSETPKTPFILWTGRRAHWFYVAFGGLCLVASFLIESELFPEKSYVGVEIATFAIASMIGLSWPLRRQPWFWVFIAAVAAVHFSAIERFDLSSLEGASNGAPKGFYFLDLLAMSGAIYLLFCLIHGKPIRAMDEIEVKRDPEDLRYSERADLDLDP